MDVVKKIGTAISSGLDVDAPNGVSRDAPNSSGPSDSSGASGSEIQRLRELVMALATRVAELEKIADCVTMGHDNVLGHGPGMYVTSTCRRCGKYETY